jgi:NAD-dependent SIR2 family protein deacetylase
MTIAAYGRIQRRILKSLFPFLLASLPPTTSSLFRRRNEANQTSFHSSTNKSFSKLSFCPTRTVGWPRYFSSFSSSALLGREEFNGVEEEMKRQESIQFLSEKLGKSKYKNVVVLMGAGASVSAGIPDFRSPGSGLYSRLQEYGLPFPEAVFDLDFFHSKPEPFTNLAKSIWPGQENGPKPTVVHSFLKILEGQGCLRRVYTQNIDGLESLAGVSSNLLVECHGHFRSASCVNCKTPMDVDKCKNIVFQGMIPKCDKCENHVKPDIVFFGEDLPMRFQQLIERDVKDCDLLLIFGTSLLVMPVAAIPSWVSRDCTRVLFNLELVGKFSNGLSERDIFLQGNCDDSVLKVCQLTGWEDELLKLQKNTQ